MWTYKFTYDESIDDFGSIQFCAKTRAEAEKLFADWCKDNDLKIEEYDVEVVYNYDDLHEYGTDYMPTAHLKLMETQANTIWCDDDIGAALMNAGIEPTEENIKKVATPEFLRGFYELMIQRGNEIIEQRVGELFD